MNLDERIEEMIAGIAGDSYDFGQDLVNMESDRDEAVYSATKHYAPLIKQLMIDEFETLIGEDKPDNSFDEDYINGWNNSLYELRQKLIKRRINNDSTK